ncbi:hypothetical protein BDZ91DRAFT_738835 [Kalaharituber pfeilii]|nr:hypothetical protein BDZ91DRAFT_738835 [Kalaharituber pfeilii]
MDISMEASTYDLAEENMRNGHDITEPEGLHSIISECPEICEDPFLSAKDALWFHTGINELVRIALEKMKKAFAYNSVFFLRAVLELQIQYLALKPFPPAAVILEIQYIQRIADIMSKRLARREKASSDLSRELQLRTLVAAISLLSQYPNFKINNDSYASLLNYVSARDYEDHVRYLTEGCWNTLGNGDCEFLVRYACDLVRCMPNDFAMFHICGFGPPAVHFMLAAGLVNQSEGDLTVGDMEQIYARIVAAPSEWHGDIRHLAEYVSHATHLKYQALSLNNTMHTVMHSESFPMNITHTIIDRIEKELAGIELIISKEDFIPPREAQLLVAGLLDLLDQLVASFSSSEIRSRVEELALKIITTSNIPEFRFKAFELIASSTTGCTSAQFLDVLTNLEIRTNTIAAKQKACGLPKFQELKNEKRAAVSKYFKKLMMYREALESLHKRLQDRDRGGANDTDRTLTASPSGERTAHERATICPTPSGTIFIQSVNSSPVSQIQSRKETSNPSLDQQQHHTLYTSNTLAALNGDVKQHGPQGKQNSQGFSDSPVFESKSLKDLQGPGKTPSSLEIPICFQRNALEPLRLSSPQQKRIQPTMSLSTEEPAESKEILPPSVPPRQCTPVKSTDSPFLRSLSISMSPEGANISAGQIIDCVAESNDSDEKLAKHEVTEKVTGDKDQDNVENSLESPGSQTNQLEHDLCIKNKEQDLQDESAVCQDEIGEAHDRESSCEAHTIEKTDESVHPHGSTPPLSGSSNSGALPPQPYSEKIPAECSDNREEITIGLGIEVRGVGGNEHQDNLLCPGDRKAKSSFDLPLQGISDADYSVSKRQTEERNNALLRLSAQSPIPVDTELAGMPQSIAADDISCSLRDGSDAPEVVEVSPVEVLGDIPMVHERSKVPKKKQSRASRLFASLPGTNIKATSGSRRSRFGSLRLNSSQSFVSVDRPKLSMIIDDAPEVVPQIEPLALRRSQTGPEIYKEKMEILRRHKKSTYSSSIAQAESSPNLSYEPSIASPGKQEIQFSSKPDYDSIASEHVYKITVKENALPFLSLDCRHVIYMSTNGFEVFMVPTPCDMVPVKPRYSYRLGEFEGWKKGKVPWEYRAGAASRRYIATITKERVQVHDLQKSCNPVFTQEADGHEYHSIAIAADKLVLGMIPIGGTIGAGVITIYKMNNPRAVGPRWEAWKNIRLTIVPSGDGDYHGAPYILALTRDGKGLTACSKSGHFFAWDIAGDHEPVLISHGRVITGEANGAETLTGAFLFPDMKNILCSTVSLSDVDPGWVGCFAEPTRPTIQPPSHHPIRQVGLKIHHSTISPNGNATAFLSRTGQINVVPILRVEGDDNITSTAATAAQQRLQPALSPETAGRIMFTPEGDKLVGVDRNGKVIVLCFTKF